MPEPLIHFIIPFFLLIMLGFSLKKSILISSLAIVPDLDVLFHIHRSMSHSVIFILALTIPAILVLTFLRIGKKSEMILAVLVILSHPFMDMFTWYTPILWPLFDKSIYILAQLTTNMNNILDLNLIFKLNFDNIIFYKTTDSEGPIFTSQGFGMTLVLMTGLMFKYVSVNNGVANMMRYGIIDIGKYRKKRK